MKYVPPLNGDLEDPDRPFIDADPAQGIEGSRPPAASIEHPQREIVAAIVAAGLVPAEGNLTQLAQAIAAMSAARGYVWSARLYVTSSGEFEKADFPGLKAIDVWGYGAAGSSGGVGATDSVQNACGAGSGAGEAAHVFLEAAELLASETMTIGAGGPAQAAGASGVDGGDTLFGAHLIAKGGKAGQAGTASTGSSQATRGQGGEGGMGDLLIPGGDGGVGRLVTGVLVALNTGGPSGGPFGATSVSSGITSTNGRAGRWPGGGASGALNFVSQAARPGAAGADGGLIIDIYI